MLRVLAARRHRLRRRAGSRSTRATGRRSRSSRSALAEAERVRRRRTSSESSPIPIELLETDLRDLLATIRNPHLAALLDRFFGAGHRRTGSASASRRRRSSTTRPTRTGSWSTRLSVAQAVSAAAAAFPGIDRDLAVTGALLHDIGKTQAYNDGPARDRPHGRGPPSRRDPDRLLPRPHARSSRSRASIPSWRRPSSTSSSPTTAPTRWARRSCPQRARRPSST